MAVALARCLAAVAGGDAALRRLLHAEALQATEDDAGDLHAMARAAALRLERRGDEWSLPFMDYLRVAPPEPGWHLAEREVDKGQVFLRGKEVRRLVAEHEAQRLLAGQHDLDPPARATLLPLLGRLGDDLQLLAPPHATDLGPVEAKRYPPCMQRLEARLRSNAPMRHEERFALVAFLHGAGMDQSSLLQLFASRADHDPAEAQYQVLHITGAGRARPYSPPSCATLQLEGICPLRERDRLCRAVRHPLGYYRARHPPETP